MEAAKQEVGLALQGFIRSDERSPKSQSSILQKSPLVLRVDKKYPRFFIYSALSSNYFSCKEGKKSLDKYKEKCLFFLYAF